VESDWEGTERTAASLLPRARRLFAVIQVTEVAISNLLQPAMSHPR
jgi:hypothetical protein